MMKKRLILTALSLVALSACPSPRSENQPPGNILEFQEQARVRVANDTMHIVLFVEAQHADRRQAAETVNRRLAALQEKLDQSKQLKVELGNRSAYPQYGRDNRITHWEDSVELRVHDKDFEAIGRIIAESQSEAVLRGVSFSVSPEARAKALQQAGGLALDAFRQRAGFLSKKLGFSGYDLLKVEMRDSFEPMQPQGVAAYAQDASVAEAAAAQVMVPADQSGEQDITQNVRVTIQMK